MCIRDRQSIESFKLDVITGKYEVPESTIEELKAVLVSLEQYGESIADDIGVNDNDTETYYSLGLFKPEDDFGPNYLSEPFFDVENYSTFKNDINIFDNDYVKCAAVAIGADALWALGGSSASSWSRAAMKKAFKAVAKRFLGPVGVAIAVVSFGVCLAGS